MSLEEKRLDVLGRYREFLKRATDKQKDSLEKAAEEAAEVADVVYYRLFSKALSEHGA